MTIVHEESRGGGVSNSECVLKERGKTKFGKDSRKIRVGDPVVGFLLIKENQRTVHRGGGRIRVRSGSLVSEVTKEITNSHGNISGVTVFDKASLMGRDQIGKHGSKARGKHPRKDLNIAIGERDRAPVSDGRKVTARLGNEGDESAGPGRRSRPSRQDRIEQGEEDGEKGICKRLIPFIRDAIRAGSPTRR
jgi:hypothetical protein